MFDVKGDRPQWAVVYERLATMKIGETVKDAELAGLLPDAPEGSVKSAFYRAVREMEDVHHRTLDRVRLTGYRVVEAAEHERLARGQHKKAKRRLKSAWRKAHSADRSRLTPDERRRLDAMEDHLGRQQEMIRRLEGRVATVEADLKNARRDQKQDTASVSDRLDRLAELLEKHGITEKQAT